MVNVWFAISLVLNGALAVVAIGGLWRGSQSRRRDFARASLTSRSMMVRRSQSRSHEAVEGRTRAVVLEVPENPTREQVHAAIYEVEKSLQGRESLSSNELELDTAKHIPLEMVPEIIEHGLDSFAGYMLLEATKKRLTAEHKEIVLETFARTGALTDVILRYGWAGDCGDAMSRLMSGRGSHRLVGNFDEYVAILSRVDSEEVWDKALEFLAGHPEYWLTLQESDASGRVTSAVAQLWEQTRFRFRPRQQLAPAAIAHGIAEGLEFATEVIGAGDVENRMIVNALYEHTDYDGPIADFPSWYAARSERMRFDPATRKFVETTSDT